MGERKIRNKDLSETKTALRKENTTLFGRGVGRDEAVKSITDQLDCKCTEEDEFDISKIKPRMSPFVLSMDSMILS